MKRNIVLLGVFISLVTCSADYGTSSGGLSAFSSTCEQSADTQAGLDCVLDGFQLLGQETVKVPNFQETGSADALAPTVTTSDSGEITLSSSNQIQTIKFDWTDPKGLTPAFCLQLCNHGVCTKYQTCTRGKVDGLKTGKFIGTGTWRAAPPGGSTGIDTKVTPISTEGVDPITADGSGGYYLPGLAVVSTGPADTPPPPNPPTKKVTAGAPLTTRIIFSNPPSGGSTSGGSGGSGTRDGTCISTPNSVCPFDSCSDGSSCWYLHGGKRYDCSSCSTGGCQNAAAAVISDCNIR